jgi:hypothetical protein
MWPRVFGSLHDYTFWQLARQVWQPLAIYYAIVFVILVLLARSSFFTAARGSTRARIGAALLLTALLTPGTISDFFLVAIPGPAIIGLALVMVVVVLHPTSLPSVILPIIGDYGLALALVFLISYGCLALLHRVPKPTVA